jgi:1,4-dihydroxy-2-naphthoyl-CoA hydrolase
MAYHRTIRLADTDAARVVYFASMLSICHEAYEEALTQAGVDFGAFFQEPTVVIPIVHGEIDLLGPISCGDRLIVELSPQIVNENRFEVAYQILAAASPEICLAKALTRHVCIDAASRRPTPLPPLVRQWLVRD